MRTHPNVKFSSPDPQSSIIKVTCLYPDGKEKEVGLIYAICGDSDTISYRPVNSAGEELMEPSEDFSLIERKFEESVLREDELSFMEDMEAKFYEYNTRESSIQRIRNWKQRFLKPLSR